MISIRRFVKRDADEKHYVLAARLATVGLFLVSSTLVFVLQTAQTTFNLVLQIGAGTGLLYLLRWYWWRVTAWCEIVAMSSSFAISVLFLFVNASETNTHVQLLLTVAFTTVCWLLTAYLGPQQPADAHRLLSEGPPVRARLAPYSQRGRDQRSRGRDLRQSG